MVGMNDGHESLTKTNPSWRFYGFLFVDFCRPKTEKEYKKKSSNWDPEKILPMFSVKGSVPFVGGFPTKLLRGGKSHNYQKCRLRDIQVSQSLIGKSCLPSTKPPFPSMFLEQLSSDTCYTLALFATSRITNQHQDDMTSFLGDWNPNQSVFHLLAGWALIPIF